MAKKQWVYSPKKPPKPKVPEAIKQEVEIKCQAFVESVLKPKCILPPPEDARWNYIVDLSTKWYRSFFYFCAQYRNPRPDALTKYFEVKFTRLEYAGKDRFNLAYMRHTGQWFEVFSSLTLDECLEMIQGNQLFWP